MQSIVLSVSFEILCYWILVRDFFLKMKIFICMLDHESLDFGSQSKLNVYLCVSFGIPCLRIIL